MGSPAVQKLLDDFHRDGDPYVAAILAWHGPGPSRPTSQLRAMLSHGQLRFRVNAAVILAHIDRSATNVIPVLVEGLSPHDDEAVAAEGDVARALARFSPQAKSALPILAGLVTKEWADSDVLKALVKIDPDGEKCVPALIRALGTRTPRSSASPRIVSVCWDRGRKTPSRPSQRW